MNDPNATHDGLLDDLEAEFMALCEKGDRNAVRYAIEESAGFECVVVGNVMALLAMKEAPGVANLATIIRDSLMETLAKSVAPRWAEKEYQKRVAATHEMVAEWAEEAA